MNREEELKAEIARLKMELANEREKNKKVVRDNTPSDFRTECLDRFKYSVYPPELAKNVRLCMFGSYQKERKKDGKLSYYTYSVQCSDMTEAQYNTYVECLFKVLDLLEEYKNKVKSEV